MRHRRRFNPLRWLRERLAQPLPLVTSDDQRARELIAAIDAGGLPLNAARVNAIARGLGLEVSKQAPVEQTIGRIRDALARCAP